MANDLNKKQNDMSKSSDKSSQQNINSNNKSGQVGSDTYSTPGSSNSFGNKKSDSSQTKR